MPRPTLEQFERLCQKPDHRRVGNWMARRISRPLALRITWIVLPCGISAHRVTLLAWSCGLAAAAAFAWGTLGGWALGALLLQLWYLLDHVDGQLARYRGTASLDGVQLDYLMHHTINLLLPMGIGWGVAARQIEPWWYLTGLVWGVALLLLGMQNDTRYKAFIQRLKRLDGRLQVMGGAGCRPRVPTPPPRRPLALTAWLARKMCETHVIMNVLSLLAVGQLLAWDTGLITGQVYLALMSSIAAFVTAVSLGRSLSKQTAEQEFAAWFEVPPGHRLIFEQGWWRVDPVEAAQAENPWATENADAERSS